MLKSVKNTRFGECNIKEKKKQSIYLVKKVSITDLFSADSLVADRAWVGSRVLILMPQKAWNAGLKPEYKTDNNRFIKRVLEMTFINAK